MYNLSRPPGYTIIYGHNQIKVYVRSIDSAAPKVFVYEKTYPDNLDLSEKIMNNPIFDFPDQETLFNYIEDLNLISKSEL